VAGEFRKTTKTGQGRDVPAVGPLADDLAVLREHADLDPEALVVANRTSGPVHLGNWRRRTFDRRRFAPG